MNTCIIYICIYIVVYIYVTCTNVYIHSFTDGYIILSHHWNEDFTVLPCPLDGCEVKNILPIEPFKQYVEARWYAERSVPRHSQMGMFCFLEWCRHLRWTGGINTWFVLSLYIFIWFILFYMYSFAYTSFICICNYLCLHLYFEVIFIIMYVYDWLYLHIYIDWRRNIFFWTKTGLKPPVARLVTASARSLRSGLSLKST